MPSTRRWNPRNRRSRARKGKRDFQAVPGKRQPNDLPLQTHTVGRTPRRAVEMWADLKARPFRRQPSDFQAVLSSPRSNPGIVSRLSPRRSAKVRGDIKRRRRLLFRTASRTSGNMTRLLPDQTSTLRTRTARANQGESGAAFTRGARSSGYKLKTGKTGL